MITRCLLLNVNASSPWDWWRLSPCLLWIPCCRNQLGSFSEIRSWLRWRQMEEAAQEVNDGGFQKPISNSPNFWSDILKPLSLETGRGFLFCFVFTLFLLFIPEAIHLTKLQITSQIHHFLSACILLPNSSHHHLPFGWRSPPSFSCGFIHPGEIVSKPWWELMSGSVVGCSLSNCAQESYNPNFFACFKIPIIRFICSLLIWFPCMWSFHLMWFSQLSSSTCSTSQVSVSSSSSSTQSFLSSLPAQQSRIHSSPSDWKVFLKIYPTHLQISGQNTSPLCSFHECSNPKSCFSFLSLRWHSSFY